MVTFNFKKIDSNARCQNYVEGYKAIDGEILAFYINHKLDMNSIKCNNTDELYSKLLSGNGIYFLFGEENNKLNIYVGRTTQGINRCIQHTNKVEVSDVNIYDKWEHVIYFTGAIQEWSVDNIYDLERMFIGFFKSDKHKWESLNIQKGNVGKSDIRELNTKIAAILSFISQERFGFNIENINKSNTVIDKYLEETAKSAIEIMEEAEKSAKQQFKEDILNKLSDQESKDLEYGRKCREYSEFKSEINGSSNYIMQGRIYDNDKDRKEQDVITLESTASTMFNEIPIKYLDGEHTFLEIASKSGNLVVPIIDALMSDDINLPINGPSKIVLEWNRTKVSRLKHIIKNLIFAQAVSYKAYLITCETIIKCIERHLSNLGVDAIREYNELPNVKYTPNYIAYAKVRGKNKARELEKIIRTGFGEDMKFDIVIGNPPYQDGTKSIYPEFIDLALNLNPKYITMIVKDNWLTSDTLKFTRNNLIEFGLRSIIDYPIIGEVFPGVQVCACIFSAEKGYVGNTQISVIKDNKLTSILHENLKNMPIIPIDKIEFSVINKILSKHEESFGKETYPQEAFRITSVMGSGRGKNAYTLDYSTIKTDEFNVAVLCQDGRQPYYNWIRENDIPSRHELLDSYKIVAGACYSKNNNVVTGINVLGPRTICNATFAPLYVNKDKVMAYGAYTYIKTKFFRYLIRIMCESGLTHHSEARFALVPMQDFSKAWTDEELYEKYGFTREEIDHIESIMKSYD